MNVEIVEFPETPVAAVEHRGAPALEHETAQRLIRWRIRHRVSPSNHKSFGVHYTDPLTALPAEHRVDFCVSYDGPIEPNEEGVISKRIPGSICAVARHRGSRQFIDAADYLVRVWLRESGAQRSDFPMFFHYINVGPDVAEEEMLTDVYLPLRRLPAPSRGG